MSRNGTAPPGVVQESVDTWRTLVELAHADRREDFYFLAASCGLADIESTWLTAKAAELD